MIPAIVLAAGKSSRMGRPKALVPLGNGHTFLTRILATFRQAGVDDLVVVLGQEAEAIRAAVGPREASVRFVVNEAYERGQLSSLLAGLRVVDRPGVSAALVTLVDVPLMTADTIRAVIDRYRSAGVPVVRPVRGDEHGHPVLVARVLFDALRSADPATGAKSVVRAHASPAGDIEVDDDGAFFDIDTPADYERALRSLRSSPAPAF